MTLLDDYDPPFKIRGIEIVHEMLRKVDANLLNRTGISTLLSSVSSFPYRGKILSNCLRIYSL
jgi:Tti2 family